MSNDIRIYPTIEAFLEQVNKSPRDRTCASVAKDHDKWAGDITLDGMIDGIKYGIESYTSGLKLARERIKLNPMETIDAELACEGTVPDVATYLTGQPECMLSFIPTTRIAPTISVYYNASVAWYIGANAIHARGAAITAVVDALESQKVRVALYAIETCSGRGDNCYVMCTLIKPADAPMDISRVAASCHPGFLRRLIFASEEAEPSTIRDRYGFHADGSYGFVRDMPPGVQLHDTIDYYIPPQRAESESGAISEVFKAVPIEKILDVPTGTIIPT